MLPPAKDSAGAHIFNEMGRCVGQGIGPRLSWRQRRVQDIQVGAREQDILGVDDPEAIKHTYAPRDTPLIIVNRGDNSHELS